jgi:peptidylprolyl isomerase
MRSGALTVGVVAMDWIGLVTPRVAIGDPVPPPKSKKEPVAKESKESKDTKKGATMEEKFVTNPSGLKYADKKVGDGKAPAAGQRVTVHYTGWLTSNGKKFDSSVDRSEPFKFVIGAGQVIKGWDEGVMSMKVGGKRTLIVPAEMAYGQRGFGSVIPPNSELKFDVELLGVE